MEKEDPKQEKPYIPRKNKDQKMAIVKVVDFAA